MNQSTEMRDQLKSDHTKMMDSLAKEKKVKIKAKSFIRPMSVSGGTKTFKPGDVLEVAESEAKEFCERKFDTYTSEAGTKPTAYAQPTIVRAEYVKAG